MIFDTHAHYDDEAFNEDRDELLDKLEQGGIGRVVNAGSNLDSCRITLKLMNQYPFLYGALGIHPSETAELNEDSFQWLKEQCKNEKCVAIGEIGLDYYWPEPDREIQKKWFIRQLELARELHLPVVVHSRDAAMDTMEIMKNQHAKEIGGVIHCFSYSKEVADVFLNMGFYIGVGGIITFKNARKLREVVIHTPIDRIVVETDCPYLAPDPNRGKRNSSLNLPYVIEKIAELKQLEVKEVEEITWINAGNLYGMKPSGTL
ncbi:MAG TPA: TatD family hydrolase [Lachnospiraceae bacterium]|nr:TatD family hydrolase [Lachnospiraceae bacterium]